MAKITPAKNAGSGVYLYAMTAGSFVESKQMMMLT
jgi:hypothetical protein